MVGVARPAGRRRVERDVANGRVGAAAAGAARTWRGRRRRPRRAGPPGHGGRSRRSRGGPAARRRRGSHARPRRRARAGDAARRPGARPGSRASPRSTAAPVAARGRGEQVVDRVALGRPRAGGQQQRLDPLRAVPARPLDRPQPAERGVPGAAAVGIDPVAKQHRDAVGVGVVVGSEDEGVFEQQRRVREALAEALRPGPPRARPRPWASSSSRWSFVRPEVAVVDRLSRRWGPPPPRAAAGQRRRLGVWRLVGRVLAVPEGARERREQGACRPRDSRRSGRRRGRAAGARRRPPSRPARRASRRRRAAAPRRTGRRRRSPPMDRRPARSRSQLRRPRRPRCGRSGEPAIRRDAACPPRARGG